LLYTILFILIWAIISLPFILRGNGLIQEDDSFNQCFPVFIYTGDYIREILRGRVYQFDFRLGLGDDVISTLAWHGLGDIIRFVPLVVLKNHAELLYILTMLLKYYLCGISFIVYSHKYIDCNMRNYSLLMNAGALLYAFTIFGFVEGLWFWVKINPMIILPLILHGIDNILENRKELSKWLIISLFIQALNGFYYLYMTIIIAAIYFLVVSFVRKKSIIKYGFAVMRQGFLGVCLGGIILLPSIIGFWSSSRISGGGGRYGVSLYSWEFYYNSFKYLFIPSAYESITTISIVLLAGAVVIITGKKLKGNDSVENKEFAILWGICGLLVCLPIFNSIMNGFSYSTIRWYFAILLFGTIATVLAMQGSKPFSRKPTTVFYIIAFLSLFINLIYSDRGLGDILRTLFYTIVIIIFPFVWNRKKNREIYLLTYIVVTVIASGLLVFGPKVLGGSGFSAGFKLYGASLSEMKESVASIERNENEFERLDVYSSSLATSLVLDYYGTAAYFSIQNAYIYEFFQELYISPGIRSASHIIRGLDSRVELASLLGVSQYTDFALDDEDELEVIIRANEYKLPLAFTYDNWISEHDFRLLNPLDKTSNMIINAVLEGEIEGSTLSMNIPTVFPNESVSIGIELLDIDSLDDSFMVMNSSTIRVWLQDFNYYNAIRSKESELFVKLSDFIVYNGVTSDIIVGNKNLQLRNPDIIYYLGVDDFWVNVTELQELNNEYYFDIRFLDENQYSLSNIEVYYHPINIENLEERAKNSLTDVYIGTNEVSGRIVTEKEELLFLSIPYSKGWTAYVNGGKTPIYRTNIAFSGILLDPGEHNVRMVYRSPGLYVGMVLSVTSLLLILVWIWWDRKNRLSAKIKFR
jgi:uncharacterized membrane protein YfhO